MRPSGTRVLAGAALALSIGLTGAGSAAAQGTTAARAELRDGSGALLGTLTLAQGGDGIMVTGQLRGLTPNLHGIHVHEVGRCEAPFTSAGEHWNPSGRQHGVNNPVGPHVGDLYNEAQPAAGSNLIADPNGVAAYRGRIRGATLTSGPTSVFDADGSALVIHAAGDDNVSDPAGNSGPRIACGVIVAGPAGLPRTGLGGATTGAAAGVVAVAGGALALAGRLLRRRR